ncbi:MAG: hypothetical protein KDK41_18215 [Leptospiraceae bacterium]|nr:hypothetical protein [Leptospiraceae bacterium]
MTLNKMLSALESDTVSNACSVFSIIQIIRMMRVREARRLRQERLRLQLRNCWHG